MGREFAKGFWELFRGYWGAPGEKGRARALLAVVIGLNFAAVYLIVLINRWYNEFYNAIQARDYGSFWWLVGKFTALALLHIVIAVYAIYLQQLLQLRWRAWMTRRYVGDWLGRQSYYRLAALPAAAMDNPDQRIQEDVQQFTQLTLGLLIGVLKQLTSLFAFAVVLWELSGVWEATVLGVPLRVPGYMLWFSLLYSAIGTALAHVVGRRLIGLQYDQQRFEADFRFSLTRVRENGESVALYGGEEAERVGIRDRFAAVMGNFRLLMAQTKRLNFYANFYAQLAIIAPLVLAAPRYFAGAIQLGGLMQTVSAFGRVQDALSYFVTVYDSVAQLLAVVKRLLDFTGHMDQVRQLSPAVGRAESQRGELIWGSVAVSLPDGRRLLAPCSLVLPRGKRLLVTGASGCGKSTLLRALAGIWTFGSGQMLVPAGDRAMFLPQRPYLPQGTLRRALCYPMPDDGSAISDETLAGLLRKVDLGGLAGSLRVADDWSRILSLGEQQRIAFARVLLLRPDWLFMDESTSALDGERESRLLALMAAELPATGVVSVGHRASLFAWHDKELRLEDGLWHLRPIADC